jgi:hypothetical protein
MSSSAYTLVYQISTGRWRWQRLYMRWYSHEIALEFWNDQYELYRVAWPHKRWDKPRVPLWVVRDRLQHECPVVLQVCLDTAAERLVLQCDDGGHSTASVDSWLVDMRPRMMAQLGVSLQHCVHNQRHWELAEVVVW